VTRFESDAESTSPVEREARREAESSGDPYLVWRDALGHHHVFSLSAEWDRAAIGRSHMADICLHHDAEVSRVHAQLEHVGDDWALVDDGLSRNGSFINGERIQSRRRLADGDELRFGDTVMRFRAPFELGEDTLVSRPS
jgi:predicted component of type VI protein secretion system